MTELPGDAPDLPATPVVPAGTTLLVGDRLVEVDAALAHALSPGDRLLAVAATGDLLHVPTAAARAARDAVDAALAAADAMRAVDDEQVSTFFRTFADRLGDDDVFAPVRRANDEDVEDARARGRSTTRLVLDAGMRADMADGLRGWADAPSRRGEVVRRVEHDGWTVEEVRDALGVVGFVFEGRPNVFADACGVLRGGNAVVFRIGSDALRTARAVVEHLLRAALAEAGLPDGAASLVDSRERSAGWALFSDPRLALAVARGSGAAVAQLGAVARQAGVPVSLHGTGGAWVVGAADADADRLRQVVRHSLDRKVCNTVNTVCVVAEAAQRLVPVVLGAVREAADARGVDPVVHITRAVDRTHAGEGWAGTGRVRRADGDHDEPLLQEIAVDRLGHEWEWEASPEMSLHVVPDVEGAVALFNRLSPRFVASLVSEDPSAHEEFWAQVDAPFVGDGMTRWVDGQYAFSAPELGLSNWQGGRLFARGAVLSGDSVYTLRTRMRQVDVDLHR